MLLTSYAAATSLQGSPPGHILCELPDGVLPCLIMLHYFCTHLNFSSASSLLSGLRSG
jgi:hypothetical protein